MTFRCPAPLRHPNGAQPARNHLPFVGGVGGTDRAREGNQRAQEASPSRSAHRTGSPRSGRPSARERAGYSRGGSPTSWPQTRPGDRRGTAEFALVHSGVSRNPKRGRWQKSSRPPWRPEQGSFFSFWCVFEAQVFVLISYFGSLC